MERIIGHGLSKTQELRILSSTKAAAQRPLTKSCPKALETIYWSPIAGPLTLKKTRLATNCVLHIYCGNSNTFPKRIPTTTGHHSFQNYNASERAIRNFKVKLKVSNFFKSTAGSDGYAIIRSVIDTAIKNNQNPYEATRLIAMLPMNE